MSYWVIAALIFAAAFLVRQYGGWKWRAALWVAGAVMLTVVFCLSISLAGVSLNTADIGYLVAIIFVVSVVISGGLVYVANLLVWFVVVFRPLRQQTLADEMKDFAVLRPAETLEDEHGLSGVLRLYEDLLATQATALDTARFHPYPTFLRDLRNSWDPHHSRQARAFIRHLRRVPNVLPRDLIGAEVVIGKLGELTTAQLSAIEACHRINLGRLRQRLIQGISIAVLITTIVGLISTIEKVGQAVESKWPDVWSSIGASSILRRNWLIIILPIIMFVVALILNRITFRPLLRRLQAFDDILTIAKAYCQAHDKRGEIGSSR